MKTFKHIALAFTALLLVTSCAIDEMWDGTDIKDEEKVLTFKPKFEDFEAVTKAIGDGSKVDKLLVQAYPDGEDAPEFSAEYDISAGSRVENIKIPFFYSKAYKVYFWAYDSDGKAYEYTTDAEGNILLNQPIKVKYPEAGGGLAYNALEHLDAFYSVQTVNLSDDVAETTDISLSRPFAQVNLGALADDFTNADVTKAQFTVKAVPTDFTLAKDKVTTSATVSDQVFTFTDFTLAENEGSIRYENADYRYVGTTYIFVLSGASKVTVDVSLYAGDKVLKEASSLEITLDPNKRTNLIFKDIAPKWDNTLADNKDDVPATETDGWIHISKPEELAALLIYGGAEGKKYHICGNLDMSGMPTDVAAKIGYPEGGFRNITIDAGIYDDHKVIGEPVGGGSYMLKNINNLKAFFGTASNITVQNIILDNVNVSGDTHVGVLVNALSGENTFKNVTIQNSSAVTTNGAAGGIVGYIERITPTDRSEKLNVTFTNCHVNGSAEKSVADGSDAEGKFVGLLNGYDFNEILTFDAYCSAGANTTVNDYTSRYTEGSEGEWLETNDYTSYNGFLGEETYNRGTIIFGANQFVPMWDGIKQVPLMEADAEYDGWSSGKVIYSAFDLASLQGLKSQEGNYYLCADVDLGGDGKDGQVGKLDKDRNMQECGADDALFNSINYIANLNGVKKDKIGADQASLTESDNYSIYNCKVVLNKHDGYGAGFIKQVTGTTNHNNINLVRAYVYNHHDEDLPDQKYFEDDNGSGNAYAGTFVSSAGGTYNISNVHVSYGHVMAVCKIGGVIGRATGVLNMSNCSVHNHTVENWEANIINWYPKAMPISSMMVYVNQSWYTQGECGGLIGFIKSMSATIDNCSVTDTDINCYGQPDKQVTAGVYTSGWTSIEAAGPNPGGIKGYTIIAGRHVNQFIGDVVSERSESRANSTDYTVTIRDYYVAGNKYFGVPVADATAKKLSEVKSHSSPRTVLYNSSPTSHAYDFTYTRRSTGLIIKTYYYTHTVTAFCDCIGSAYYVGVDVDVLGILERHVMDCAGTLIFNEKGKSAVTVTEAIKDGNNIAWTGGDFWM